MSDLASGPSDEFDDRFWRTRGSILKNVGLNVLGQGLPLITAVVAIPILVASIGVARFGLLALAWSIVGYFTVFDFGLGRAVTREVVAALSGKRSDLTAAVWPAVGAILLLGTAGGFLFAAATPWIVGDVLNVPNRLVNEAQSALYWIAVAIPVVISTPALRGVLEAQGRFGLINAVRIPTGIWTFCGPLLVLPVSHHLPPVVAVVVAGRYAAWIAHVALCLGTLPELRARPSIQGDRLRAMARFGGWLTVSNVVAPALITADRFLVGALVSTSAVAYYAAPYDAVTKVLLVPISLGAVLFPAFAALANQHGGKVATLVRRGTGFLILTIFPISLFIVTFAHELLSVWLGERFASEGDVVLQLLAIGVLANCLSFVPYSLVQGRGRADLTARVHLAEVVPYFVLLLALIETLGIDGAALAWLLRALVDCLLLSWFAAREALPESRWFQWVSVALGALAVSLAVVAAAPAEIRLEVAALVAVGFAFASWRSLIEDGDRAWLRERALALGSRTRS